MKTAVLLSYKGLGANLLHLSYCHEIAKRFGPISIITLCKNLEEALIKDPLVKEVIYLETKKVNINILHNLVKFVFYSFHQSSDIKYTLNISR